MASIYKIIYYICLTNIYEIELLLKGVNPIFFLKKRTLFKVCLGDALN
jgi:hypothetical protein